MTFELKNRVLLYMKINHTTDLQIKSLNNENSKVPENIKLLQNHFL